MRLDVAKSGRVREDAGFVAVNLSLSKPYERPVTVSWETQSGSAVGVLDYVPWSESVTFAPHETVKTVQIVILDDTVAESDETFTVRLYDPIGVVLDDFPSAMVEILDDDRPTPTSTLTGTPGPTPTLSHMPPTSAACVATITSIPHNGSPMPDLAITLPTMLPMPTYPITATIAVSLTNMLDIVATIQSGLETPLAGIGTATANYSYESGQEAAGTITAQMEPGMEWVALANPAAPAWQEEGGPLWALWPALWPVLPIISITLVVTLLRFFLWVFAWALKIIDIIFKILELIPGE